MKLAIIGGAGVRTPLLVHGLTHSDVPIDDDRAVRPGRRTPGDHRAAGGAAVGGRRRLGRGDAGGVPRRCGLRVHQHPRRRHRQDAARDEQTALAPRDRRSGNGRTRRASRWRCGPSRQIVRLRAGGRARTRRTPGSSISPTRSGWSPRRCAPPRGARIIGICDTPTELFEEIAHALDLPSSECYFDYFGLNHLGWVREVYHRGRPHARPRCSSDAGASGVGLPRAAVRRRLPAGAAAAADRVSLLLLPPARRLRAPAAGRQQPRRRSSRR